MEKPSPGDIPRRLTEWYGRHRRDLPWRRTTDPYAIWVSEIMLQQTGVETVVPFYERFMARFPTVEALAAAPLDDVLKAWENLGYYGRARNLHRAARIVVNEMGGRLPSDLSALLSLPGIGKYTAGAILSMAFGKPVPALDGNVRRVLSRLFALPEAVDRPAGAKILEARAADLVPEENPGTFNQSLMELGALVCLPGTPRCPSCPLASSCEGRRRGIQESLPVTSPKAPLPTRTFVTALLLSTDGRCLLVRRPEKGLLSGLWAFPTTAWNGGDPVAWLEEQAASAIREIEPLPAVRHAYTHFRAVVRPFLCRLGEAAPKMEARQGHAWIGFREFDRYALSALDRKLLKNLLPWENGTERPSERSGGP